LAVEKDDARLIFFVMAHDEIGRIRRDCFASQSLCFSRQKSACGRLAAGALGVREAWPASTLTRFGAHGSVFIEGLLD
jgi:hypothetical protein